MADYSLEGITTMLRIKYNKSSLLQNPIIICLQKLRILYHPKYLSELSLTNKTHLRYLIHFRNDLQMKVD